MKLCDNLRTLCQVDEGSWHKDVEALEDSKKITKLSCDLKKMLCLSS